VSTTIVASASTLLQTENEKKKKEEVYIDHSLGYYMLTVCIFPD
jgi:hypothetical protein